MKSIKCQKDNAPCDLNTRAKQCRHGGWAGKCENRIEVKEKSSRKARGPVDVAE
jgi:hypothetical protein